MGQSGKGSAAYIKTAFGTGAVVDAPAAAPKRIYFLSNPIILVHIKTRRGNFTNPIFNLKSLIIVGVYCAQYPKL